LTDSSRRFAEEIYRIEQLALGHATSPQLGQSRMDGGILEWGDEDGNVIGRIGPDGSGSLDIEYIEGPKPPRPSTPVVTSDAGFVRVRWDGDWASNEEPEAIADPDVMATADADRVEIHLSLDENFVPDRVVSFAGTLPVVDGGGDSAIGPLTESGTYWCVLMARSKAGKYSEPSERVAVEVSTVNLESELFGLALKADEAMESADGKNSVYYGDEEPEPKQVTDEDGNPVLDEDGNPIYTEFRDGDIWFGEGNLPHIWSEESGEWVSVRDSRLDELQDAIDNIEVDFDTDSVLAEARDEAQRLADQARDAAIAADATTFWLPEEVAGDEPQHWGEYAPQNPKEGDLALVPNLPGLGGGFISYRYRSGAWVEASDAIAQAAMEFTGVALSRANEAQQTANGKNKITRSLDNPPVVYTGAVNDLWWRLSSMGSGGRVISQWRWNGSVWVSELVGDETIANLNAAKITAGYLDAARIQAQSISVDKLIVSSNANLLSDPQFASGGAGWAGRLNGPIGPDSEFVNVPDGPGGVFAPIARITVPAKDFTAFYSKSWPQFPESGSDPLQGMQGTEVRPGESYRFVLRARVVQRPTTGVGGLRLRGGFSLNGGSRQWPLLTDNLLTDAPLGEWRDVTGVWAHPGGTEARNRLSVGIHAAAAAGAIFEVAFVGMYAMTTSELIVDGAVTARTVSAGAIGATAIAAEAIEGRHVKAGSLLADAVLVPGSVGGTLIADGAVTTNHLKAGSITAESGIIGSLDAGVITTGELRGELIRAGSIAGRALAADAIDGKTITGATIRTASAGARVELTQNGLRQYNAFGQTIVDMTGGSVSVVGALSTGLELDRRVEIRNDIWPSGAGIVFLPEGGLTAESKTLTQSRIGSPSDGDIYIASAESENTSRNSVELSRSGSVTMSSSRLYGGTDLGQDLAVVSVENGDNAAQRGVYMGTGWKPDPQLRRMGSYVAINGRVADSHWSGGGRNAVTVAATSDLRLLGGRVLLGNYADRDSADARVAFDLASSSGDVNMRFPRGSGSISTAGNLKLRHTGDLVAPDIPTYTGTTGGLRWRTGLIVVKDGSSRRYKLLEEPISNEIPDLEDRFLGLEYKTWIDKGNAEAYADAISTQNTHDLSHIEPIERIPGLIAEDLHDAGLGMFVMYDEQGRPENINREAVGMAWIPVVKNQRDRIQALEKELEQIKETINA
jgi:hypothetical protein